MLSFIQQAARQRALDFKAADYDMPAYIKKYGQPDQSKGQHLTDEFKLPGHITFSTDSIYSTPQTPGGEWKRLPDGTWQYTPSSYVLNQRPLQELIDYFRDYEPDSILNLNGVK